MKHIKKREMNKLFIKIFVFTICVLSCNSVYADTEESLLLGVSVPPTVAISKSPESIENGSATPGSGVVPTDLKSVFTLQTTGTDSDYDFIVTSSINTESGAVSAYGKNNSILFANTTHLPTLSAVNDAKAWGKNNSNVIVYPLTVTVENPMTFTHYDTHATYGDCYKVLVNSGTGGKVTNTVSGTPISNTYDVTRDVAGSYQTVITFTAVGK